MSTASQETVEYFRLEGARILLRQYADHHQDIPADDATWRADLAPVVRGIWNAESGGGRTRYEIGAQLRTAADLFDAHPDGSHHAVRNFPMSETRQHTAAVFREIAGHLEGRPAPLTGDDRFTLPHTERELAMRFPRLRDVLPVYFGQDGTAVCDDMQDATTEEGILMLIDEAHPSCPWRLPGVIAECHEALALFHTETQLDYFFSGPAIGGGSGSEDFTDFFPLLARLCMEHMREHHSPIWEPK